MIVDTSALLAFFDRAEPAHSAVSAVIEASGAPLVVSPYVLAELDHLVTHHAVPAELAALDELTGGAWELTCLDRTELRAARDLVAKYRDHRIGLADASIVVLAERFGSTVVTLDRRHFCGPAHLVRRNPRRCALTGTDRGNSAATPGSTPSAR